MSRMWEIRHVFYLQVKHPFLKHLRVSPDSLGAPSRLFFEAKDSHAFLSVCVFPSFLPSLPPFFLFVSFFLHLFDSIQFKVQKTTGERATYGLN